MIVDNIGYCRTLKYKLLSEIGNHCQTQIQIMLIGKCALIGSQTNQSTEHGATTEQWTVIYLLFYNDFQRIHYIVLLCGFVTYHEDQNLRICIHFRVKPLLNFPGLYL